MTGLNVGAPDIKALRPRASAYEQNLRKWFASREREFKAESVGQTLELTLMGTLGEACWFEPEGISADDVKAALDAYPNVTAINVLIDCPGGDVFEGMSIMNLLKRSSAHVTIEVIGEASSAGTFVCMGGDKIVMHEGTAMMVHQPAGGMFGSSAEHRTIADALDSIGASMVDIYVARTGKPRDQVQKLVDAETWMTARQAIELGFADVLAPGKAKASAAQPTPATPPAITPPAEPESAPTQEITVTIEVEQARAKANAQANSSSPAAVTVTAPELTDEERQIAAAAADKAVVDWRANQQREFFDNHPFARAVAPLAPPAGGMRSR